MSDIDLSAAEVEMENHWPQTGDYRISDPDEYGESSVEYPCACGFWWKQEDDTAWERHVVSVLAPLIRNAP